MFVTELVVSELVTNAVRYATGPVRLRLVRDETLVCVVSDGSSTSPHLSGGCRRRPQYPVAKSADPAAERRAATRSSTYWSVRQPKPHAARVSMAPVRCASWK